MVARGMSLLLQDPGCAISTSLIPSSATSEDGAYYFCAG